MQNMPLDPVYAASLGVDVENLLVSQPDTGEMALEIVDQLIRSSAVDLVVVDSVAALNSKGRNRRRNGRSRNRKPSKANESSDEKNNR